MDEFRRNSEAYALMILPVYWDLFAASTEPDGTGGTQSIGPSWVGQGVWFLLLTAITFFLPSTLPADIGLPQSIITLREAVLGLLVISAYFGWSRSILPGRLHIIDGRPTVSRNARIAYYATVAILAVVVNLGWVGRVAGTVGDWLEADIEAFAAIFDPSVLRSDRASKGVVDPDRMVRVPWPPDPRPGRIPRRGPPLRAPTGSGGPPRRSSRRSSSRPISTSGGVRSGRRRASARGIHPHRALQKPFDPGWLRAFVDRRVAETHMHFQDVEADRRVEARPLDVDHSHRGRTERLPRSGNDRGHHVQKRGVDGTRSATGRIRPARSARCAPSPRRWDARTGWPCSRVSSPRATGRT